MSVVRKVFIRCPRVVSGGPELLHQLCDRLNVLGAQAYIWYEPNPHGDHSPVFPEYGNVRIAEAVEDEPGNLLIIPETVSINATRANYSRVHLAMYWLSFMNAAACEFFLDNVLAENKVIHLFQSYYEYAMVRPLLSWSTGWFFLTDHINDEYLSLDAESFVAGKQDIVCFNGNKDKISGHVCEEAGIPNIAIKDMSRAEVLATLRKCTVYMDNGHHPGKDRLPREAAMNGCVVITNKSGSAVYIEDVPIEEKSVLVSDLYDLVPTVLANYRHYFDKQQNYRECIRQERAAFEHNVQNFWRQINGG